MTLLDTHVLIWLTTDPDQLGDEARRLIDREWKGEGLAVSAISFWEVGMLKEKKRISLSIPVEQWRGQLLASGLIEIPVDGRTAIAASALRKFHGDPADRIIVATVELLHSKLITADRRLVKRSWAIDARH